MATPVEYICKHKPNSALHGTPIKHQRNDTDAIPAFAISNNWKYQQRSTRGVHDLASLGDADSSVGTNAARRRRSGKFGQCARILLTTVSRTELRSLLDGGRCARVKYDDYDRDEIGSRSFSAAH